MTYPLKIHISKEDSPFHAACHLAIFRGVLIRTHLYYWPGEP
jgi:hypothetical protein